MFFYLDEYELLSRPRVAGHYSTNIAENRKLYYANIDVHGLRRERVTTARTFWWLPLWCAWRPLPVPREEEFSVFCFALRMLSRGGIYTRNDKEPKPTDELSGLKFLILFYFLISQSSVGTLALFSPLFMLFRFRANIFWSYYLFIYSYKTII